MTEPRAIDTSNYAKLNVPSSFGRPPKLEWLRISALVVDREYQREITAVGRKNIRRIAENFNWAMFGTVMVAAIGGDRYAIVDGQHRTTAAALVGIEKVPCQVVEALRGEQAAAFRAINNNTTKPHTVQLFHAAVTAGETSALRVVAVCSKAGIKIARSLGVLRHYETFCAGVIGKSIERHGEALTELALRMIVASGDGRPEDLNRAIIVATTEVLARNLEWQKREKDLKEAFLDFDLVDLWRASTAEAARIRGSSSIEVLQTKLTRRLTAKMGKAA